MIFWSKLLTRDLYRYHTQDTSSGDLGRAYYGVNGVFRGIADNKKTWTQARVEAEADYFASPPFIFHAAYEFEREGDQDMTAPFGDTRSKFPLGIFEKTQTVDVSARYIPNIRFQALVQIRWQGMKNAFHISGKSEDLFEASVQVFYNFNWAWWW